MIKIKKEEFVKAIEKASVGVKDTYIISISDKKAGDGRNFASICASNGNTQVLACFMVESDKAVSFYVGAELFGVVKALGEFGDEYEIEVTKTVAKITVGSATSPIPLKTEGFSISIRQPKDEPTCSFATIDREEFVRAIKQGSFAYGGTGSDSNIANAVALLPYTKDNDSGLFFMSSDARLVARSSAKVSQANESFKKADSKYINIDAPALRAISSKLDGDNITIFLFEKQVLIKDGNDYYTIIRYETAFPKVIGEMLDITEYNYKAVFDISMLKAALRVATIMDNKNEKKAVIDIQNGKVTISSILGTNKAEVKADNVEGEINIYINAKHLEMVMADIGAEKLTIYGQGELKPLYMKDGLFNGMMTPILKETK